MTKSRALLSAALLLCLMGTSAVMAQQPLADVDVGDSSIVWHPVVGDKMVLTVSGPSGDFRYEVAAGEKPAMEIFDKNGGLLQDGTYTWQLTNQPSMSDETRAAMQKSRQEGTRFVGVLPQGFSQSGHFTVKGGYFVLPLQEVAQPGQSVVPNKDQQILDDLIVVGSACVGQDCVNGESFGFDTLRLKENNLRIKFQDTSNSASFPTNDWQLTANDTGNGGANKFSIDDIDGGRTPFTIEASAPSNSLYVDDGGRVGLGTATPVVELHVVNGDSPTLRLEQNGSSGFTPQTWDLAGNETNFFVRDATNGSRLPFKIRPSAPTNSLYIDTDGDIGLGDASPDAALNLERNNGTAQLLVEETTTTAGAYTLMNLITTSTGNVRPRFTMTHSGTSSGATSWNFDILNASGNFAIIRGGGGPQFTFESTTGNFAITGGTTGNVSIPGNFISNGMTLTVPDFVFADDYELMPLDEVKAFIEKESHLPEVPSAKQVKAEGLNITDMQLKLLQKVEELTLYTLDQHDTIRTQQDTIQQLMERLEALESAQQ